MKGVRRELEFLKECNEREVSFTRKLNEIQKQQETNGKKLSKLRGER